MQKLDENETYFIIKDHKDRFPEKMSYRLINPSKTDIRKIRKQILERVNNTTSEKNKVNQWKSTSSVIELYRDIKQKDQCSFVVFDIEVFIRLFQLFDEAI